MLEVQANSYRNVDHKDSAGLCCERHRMNNCIPWWCFYCECDNYFLFCLRNSETGMESNRGNCPLGSYSTYVAEDDSFTFGNRIAGGVLSFCGDVWPVSYSKCTLIIIRITKICLYF